MKSLNNFKKQCKIFCKPTSFENLEAYGKRKVESLVHCGSMSGLRSAETIKVEMEKFKEIFKKQICILAETTNIEYYGKLIDNIIHWCFQTGKSKFDSDKGLYFYGKPGTGKTTVIEALCKTLENIRLANNERQRDGDVPVIDWFTYNRGKKIDYTFVPVHQSGIMTDFYKSGIEGIEKYWCCKSDFGQAQINATETGSVYIHNDAKWFPFLVIDDYGELQTLGLQKSYGNSIDVMNLIIKNRYDNQLLTCVTSNKNIDENADEALKDRFKNFFNFVDFDDFISESFRDKK